jgi:hypothetical protein
LGSRLWRLVVEQQVICQAFADNWHATSGMLIQQQGVGDDGVGMSKPEGSF